MNKHYIKDDLLLKEIIISKGQGKRTIKLDEYFILLNENVIKKIAYKYNDIDILNDCKMYGYLMLIENWYKFDDKKYNLALPYCTELLKRGYTEGYNIINDRKYYNPFQRKIRIDMFDYNNF